MKPLAQAIALILLAAVLSTCGMCSNDVVQTIASPSGQLKAVVFHRGCGATTGFSTQVSIIPAKDSLPNTGGNTLVIADKVPLHVQWQSASALRLSGIGSDKVYKQESKVSGIVVSYGK